MKKVHLFLMMTAMILALGCGGSDGDEPVKEPLPKEDPNNGGDNNGSDNNGGDDEGLVQVTCYTCLGSGNCTTCNGTKKGCKQCGGTGNFCDDCNTTGKCIRCYGSGNCDTCNGKGEVRCYSCSGSGKCKYCVNGKLYVNSSVGWIDCNVCGGSNRCKTCNGYGTQDCTYCSHGECWLCKGEKVCPTCKGTPSCKKCGGDGHCPDCNNSDGKCTTCGGKGYTMEKKGTPNPQDEYVTVSQISVEFSEEGGTETVKVSANVTWTVASNTASSWLTITKVDDGTLKMEATTNSATQQRSGTVTLKGRSKSVEINIFQAAVFGNSSFYVNGVYFKMIAVEAGTFTMGATEEQGNDAYHEEKPAHSVTLTRFSIGETEVTQELWAAVMDYNPATYTNDSRAVWNVSWNDCQTFISKLNQLTGQRFRLPTEAEWEYAARGGQKSNGYKYSGSNTIDDVAWYNEANLPHKVSTKKANELGIYDMSGNVEEWCNDWYDENYYSNSPAKNPTGPSSGERRVIRGGYYWSSAKFCRVSSRNSRQESYKSADVGLRLAMD